MPTIKIEPTIFIFLGSSAGQVGWRLKQLLDEAYGDIPLFRYFWVDTDTNLSDETARWTRSKNVDRVSLTGFDANEVLDNLSKWPDIQAWWPAKSKLRPGHISRGAHQIRLAGRLAFFRMFNMSETDPEGPFYNRLKKAIEKTRQIQTQSAARSMTTKDFEIRIDSTKTRVVVVFSTCGGTGSSMAFDVAYLCHDLLRGMSHSITAYAVLPPVIEPDLETESDSQQNKIKANTYAWFKEHDYLVANSTWKGSYPGGLKFTSSAIPFDNTFIFDLENEKRDRLNESSDVYNMISQAIFMNTGNALAQNDSSFSDNNGICNQFWGDALRTYSSLATVALIYPKGRILNYCRTSLAEKMIEEGFLCEPAPGQVNTLVSGLISRLKLRDVDQTLTAGKHISNDNEPAILQAKSPSEVRTLVTNQQEADRKTIIALKESIQKAAVLLKNNLGKELEKAVVNIALSEGVKAAQQVVETLLKPAEGDTSLSFGGLKKRLRTTEADIASARSSFEEGTKRLREMETNWVDEAMRHLTKKTWQERFNGARTDCLEHLAEANQLGLQVAAEKEAIGIYDELADAAAKMKDKLASLAQVLSLAQNELNLAADEALKKTERKDFVYELTLEAVNSDYIGKYYADEATSISPLTAFKEFSKDYLGLSLDDLKKWNKTFLKKTLPDYTEQFFKEKLDNISLLKEMAEYYKDQPGKIEAMFDELVEYCSPFWRYNRDQGMPTPEGRSVLGVEADSDLIPEKYRDHPRYRINQTGFKDRVYAVRVLHGVPTALLRDIGTWKNQYDEFRVGLDPLHILPEMMGDEKIESRQVFAWGLAFDYIAKRGMYFYFDPDKVYGNPIARPNKDNKLDEGRINAEDAFIKHDEWVELIKQRIDKEIQDMGNKKADELIKQKIQELDESKIVMPGNSELRPQMDKEIAALNMLIRRLSSVG